MNLSSVVDNLISDTLGSSLPLFCPELALCATIVLLLFVRIFRSGSAIPPFLLALGGAVAALWLALPQEGLASWTAIEPQEIFTKLLVYDSLSAYIRVFLLGFAVLFIVLSHLTGIADREDGQDYFVLVLGATLGMCIMASANHMLTIFLGIEMASVPSYVLAGIVKGRSRSSEAALKYAIYGAGAAGVMLYGISLLCGVLGSAHLPTMARELAALDIPNMIASGGDKRTLMVLALGGLMMGAGLAFKLSAVPFHFWCPDVFEGASAEVDAFLSVASKAAALALLLRVGFGLGHVPEDPQSIVADARAPVALAAVTTTSEPTLFQKQVVQVEVGEASGSPLSPVRRFFVILVAIISVVTCTFGNLAAYGQTNIKRMLAYSTIAHAGYMMMAVAAAVALIDGRGEQSQAAISALLLYLAVYLFMNLGAFAIIAFLRNSMQSEEIKDYAGLIRTCPMTAVMMTAVLVSLIGLPPLAGFWPKLRVLQSLYLAGGPLMMVLLVVAAVNTVISLIYYLRVAKTMCIDKPPDSRGPVTLGFLPAAYVFAVTLPVLLLGILPEECAKWADEAARHLFG
ncbi:MAG: NADH-quinone oxidoreductase subunit N [Pirellulales bacterium]|nr:NADH-quinone oxidoreductase subunit N [Pirellulales bacterium]